jgi:tol-pal system protein YbgF
MTEFRPWSRISGVFPTGNTPFLFLLPFVAAVSVTIQAAQNPISVESLSEDRQAGIGKVSETVPYQMPIEEDPVTGHDGIESQYQLQLLQREVMELRGLVEELNHQIERMRATEEDRYLELDGRFQDMRQEIGNASTAAYDPAVVNEPEAAPDSGTTVADGRDEKTLYETALELIRNRQYDLAITQLQAVIAQYPDGSYAPNAYYWLGEVYAAKPEPDYDAARQALAQVITFFPDHRKVPDAAFKLGKVYHLIGDCDRARELLNQVIEQQKGKSVAKLAESYLRDKVRCE